MGAGTRLSPFQVSNPNSSMCAAMLDQTCYAPSLSLQELCPAGVTYQSEQVVELFKELEAMSLALQQKEQENEMLREELATCKAIHARDIDELDAMLRRLVQPLAEDME